MIENIILENLQRMISIARGIIHDEDLALDIVHDTARHFLEDPDTLILAKRPVGLLLTACRHRAYDVRKSKWFYIRNSGQPNESIPDSISDPSEVAAKNDRLKLIICYLDNLPPDTQAIIHLHFWEGLTFAEISTVIHQNPRTVHSKYRRAMERIRDQMTADGLPGKIRHL